MQATEYDQFSKILEYIRNIKIPTRERTYFDLGGKGHFENPLSNLLRFFLDTNECHGMGSAFLLALHEAIGLDYDAPPSSSVLREVISDLGNRLDIAVIFPDSAILIEVKVYHHQNGNDFIDYENSIASQCHLDLANITKIILSPHGKVENNIAVEAGWKGLKFARLAKHLRSALFTQQLSKWRVLAEELILHLENFENRNTMDPKSIIFIEKHLADIKKLEYIKDQYMKDLESRLIESFKNLANDNFASSKRMKWGDNWGDVIEIRPSKWGSMAKIVFEPTFTDDNTKSGISIWVSSDFNKEIYGRIKKTMTHAGLKLEGGNKQEIYSRFDFESIDNAFDVFKKIAVEFRKSIEENEEEVALS